MTEELPPTGPIESADPYPQAPFYEEKPELVVKLPGEDTLDDLGVRATAISREDMTAEERRLHENASVSMSSIADIMRSPEAHGVNRGSSYRGLPFFTGELSGLYTDDVDSTYFEVRVSERHRTTPGIAPVAHLAAEAGENMATRTECIYDSRIPDVVRIMGPGTLSEKSANTLRRAAISLARLYFEDDDSIARRLEETAFPGLWPSA